VNVLLVHGMGRTPASMFLLAARLRARDLRPRFFGYSATFESFAGCSKRLADRMEACAREGPYIAVTHSLGAVLLRAAIPNVVSPPAMCFLLAPPSVACKAARFFVDKRAYQCVTQEIGRLLADPAFMSSLPIPTVPTRIYAGTAGPRGRTLPFGFELNDGVLAVDETTLSPLQVTLVPSLHTFIMNSRRIADDIAAASAEFISNPRAAP
jgi:hypothetical protein